ncbi:MAG: hypothetical protein AAF293_16635 [Pseudomonadota bacterium]
MNIDAKASAFEQGTLDAAGFSHRDHIAVAIGLLQRYAFKKAAHLYASRIDAMARAAGAPDKFNTTITLAFLSLIAERMQTTPHEDFDTFLDRNTDLLDRSVLSRWYGTERLTSDLAKRVFLLPDPA